MNYKIADLSRVIEELAPLHLAEEWDNCGLVIGSAEAEVERICLALDVDEAAIEKAMDFAAQLLVVHHPPIFSGIRQLNEAVPEIRNINRLIRSGIGVYVAHTNLDAAVGGINDSMAEVLGLQVYATLFPHSLQIGRFADEQHQAGFVRLCQTETALDFKTFLVRVNQHLQTSGCVLSGVSERHIAKVALSGGAFDEDWVDALTGSGVDCLVCGEIKHHQLLLLEARGIRTIAAGHDCTERVILKPLAAYLEAELPGLQAVTYTGLDYNILM